MAHWAAILTETFIEGAFQRARATAATVGSRHVATLIYPDVTLGTPAVLDPFSVYEKGESVLRAELSALASWHLVNIVTGYQLSSNSEATLNALPPAALIDLIVAAVRTESTASK